MIARLLRLRVATFCFLSRRPFRRSARSAPSAAINAGIKAVARIFGIIARKIYLTWTDSAKSILVARRLKAKGVAGRSYGSSIARIGTDVCPMHRSNGRLGDSTAGFYPNSITSLPIDTNLQGIAGKANFAEDACNSLPTEITRSNRVSSTAVPYSPCN